KVVQALRPGTSVALLVRRPTSSGPRTFRLVVRTISLGGATVVGIQPRLTFTADPSHLPYRVTIDNGNVEGSSAGLMLALSIINRLAPVDLTHGHKIAGTGDIGSDGAVAPVPVCLGRSWQQEAERTVEPLRHAAKPEQG